MLWRSFGLSRCASKRDCGRSNLCFVHIKSCSFVRNGYSYQMHHMWLAPRLRIPLF